jgi:hypothetical protein
MQRITSDRGSIFYLCGRSSHDPRFPKYSRLPVIQCPGYDPKVLRIHKAGHEIRSLADWFQWAPPKMGARQWKDGRSAKELRYQLLRAAAATLIETVANGAELGLFLVHEFRCPKLNEKKLAQNSTDWENFVHAFPELATARLEKTRSLARFPYRASAVCHILRRFISGNW